VSTRIVFAFLALSLLAARPVFAQANPNVAYQVALLARPLSAADQAYCNDGRASSQNDQDICHVTRLFLIDAAAHLNKGFPPLANIRYTNNDVERAQIMDLMTKYFG
jgi:hypothetical protein